MKKLLLLASIGWAIGASAFGTRVPSTASPQQIAQIPPQAELQRRGCQYLREVSTGQVQIRKTIRIGLGPFVRRGNENTDFAIPAGTRYSSYIATMRPENNASYDAQINLKYPEGRSDTVYDRSYPMEPGRTYSLAFRPPTGEQPYQVNLKIGGRNGNAYTISVIACQRE